MRNRERGRKRERERERGGDTCRGRSRLHAGSPTWDPHPRSPGSCSGLKAAPNRWATEAALFYVFLNGKTKHCEDVISK